MKGAACVRPGRRNHTRERRADLQITEYVPGRRGIASTSLQPLPSTKKIRERPDGHHKPEEFTIFGAEARSGRSGGLTTTATRKTEAGAAGIQ